MKKAKVMATIAMLFALVLFGFQNCSEVEFASTDDVAGKAGNELEIGEPEAPVPGEEGGEEGGEEEEAPVEVVEFKCDISNISDVRLNIDKVYVNNEVVESLVGLQSLNSLAAGFNIKIKNALQASQVRILLAPLNNQVISGTNVAYALKTPSAQQSGLKINLPAHTKLSANTAYTISFNFDSDFQVVRAGKKCLLKPVFHAQSVTEVEF